MTASDTSSAGPPPPGPDPATGLYPGQSAPLAAVTATDQGGVVVIGTALALVFALVSILIRLYVRFQFQRSVVSRDDVASAASLVFFIIQAGLVFGQVHQGLGKTMEDVSPFGLVALQKSEYASDIFYLFTIYLTKCAIAFLFIRLSPDRNHIRAAWVCLAAATLFILTSLLATCLRCNLAEPWILVGAQCPGLLARWQTAAALDIVTEAALFAVAFYMTQGIKTSVAKKSIVLLAFGLRLLVLIPIILRLLYLAAELSSPDPTLDGVMTTLCTQTHISYAILSTTTPCLRPFMSALSTHYGGPKHTRTPTGTRQLSGATGGSGSKLSKLTGGSGGGTSSDTRSKSHASHRPVSISIAENALRSSSYALDNIKPGSPSSSSDSQHQKNRNKRLSRTPEVPAPVAIAPVAIAPGGGSAAAASAAARWGRPCSSAYRAAVVVSPRHSHTGSGDAGSTQSTESQQRMIIEKNTEWQVEFQVDGDADAREGQRDSRQF